MTQDFNCCCCLVPNSWLFATPWTVACQSPLSTGFCRQEYWRGFPFPFPGDLLNLGTDRQILYQWATSEAPCFNCCLFTKLSLTLFQPHGLWEDCFLIPPLCFFKKIFIRVADFQCCVTFCCAANWLSQLYVYTDIHTYTYSFLEFFSHIGH